MPRTTRRSLAAAKEESTSEESPRSTSRGRRSTAKKEEPKVEEVPIGEPQDVTPKRNSRQSASKAKEPEAVAPTSRGRATSKGRSSARGSQRGKAAAENEEEEEDQEMEEKESDEPEKEVKPAGRGNRRGGRATSAAKAETPAPASRGSSRGSRGRTAKTEEDEQEASVEEEKSKDEETSEETFVAVKGRGSRGKGRAAKPEVTPSPKAGRSSRRGISAAEDEEEKETEGVEEEKVSAEAEKEQTSPVKKSPAKAKTTPQKTEDVKEAPSEEAESKMETQAPEAEDKPEVPPPEVESKSEEPVPEEDSKKQESAEEPMEAEESAQKAESGLSNKKRKLEEDVDDEEDSAAKRSKTEKEELSDFVVVNKEDVPSADSKEVQESVPKPPAPSASAEQPVATPSEAAEASPPAPPVVEGGPVVVPLTEAELAKQYTKSHMDRDETSSTLVEVGSEATSDITSMSVRSLDVSDAVSMDSTSTAADDAPNVSGFLAPPSSAPKVTMPVPATSTPAVAAPTPAPSALLTDKPTAPQQQQNSVPASDPSDHQNNGQLDDKTEQNSGVSEQNSGVSEQSSGVSVLSSPAAAADEVEKVVPQSSPVATSTPAHNAQQKSAAATATATATGASNGEVAAQTGAAQNSSPETIPVPSPVKAAPSLPSSTAIDCRKFVMNPSFPAELMDPAFCFSVVTYNILAECHWKRGDYSYTAPQYMALDYRHALMMKELNYLDGDIVCMQEVEPKYYQETLLPAMTSRGYSGWFIKRTKDYWDEGEATFVRNSRFRVKSSEGYSLKELAYKEVDESGLSAEVSTAVKEYLDRADVLMVTQVECLKTGKTLTVANIHVVYAPPAPDVQCIQVACSIKQLVSKAGNDLSPHIICGDFNSLVTSAGYQLAKDGYLSDDHIRRLQALEALNNTDGSSRSLIHHMWKAFQHTSSNLKSAYEVTMGKEPPVTTCTKSQQGKCLDYMFFSSASLDTVGVMETLDASLPDVKTGLPSANVPSDHLSLKAVFRIK